MKQIHRFIATGGYTGYFPKIPGTVATLAGTLLFYPIHFLGIVYQAGLIVMFFGIGLVSASRLEKELGSKDPSVVVIDEIVGIWIALYLIPFNWKSLLTAFILFRFFDIRKPLRIRSLQTFDSGWGIMLDDALAGIYTNLILRIAYMAKPLILS
ncbi:MAG: phosphatidylglycerophosphatase A [Nitrospirae bacterium]|nr:phosphatidylglycerophosphatase A [Nitrospirota bacterium]MBI3595048.1 phosphatidylglycerophosphatase A [Nitrospirota bacterium]